MAAHRSDDDFDREIAAHLDLETDQLVAEGLSPDAAQSEARKRFGNVTAVRERFHESQRVLWLDHLGRTYGMRAGCCAATPPSPRWPS